MKKWWFDSTCELIEEKDTMKEKVIKFCSQCSKETYSEWKKCPLKENGFRSPVKMKKCCCCDLCRSRCSDEI